MSKVHDQRYRGEKHGTAPDWLFISSIVSSVIRGVGEMDVHRTHQPRASATPQTPASEQLDLEHDERPYLIVDLRDKDEFRANHIVSGQ